MVLQSVAQITMPDNLVDETVKVFAHEVNQMFILANNAHNERLLRDQTLQNQINDLVKKVNDMSDNKRSPTSSRVRTSGSRAITGLKTLKSNKEEFKIWNDKLVNAFAYDV